MYTAFNSATERFALQFQSWLARIWWTNVRIHGAPVCSARTPENVDPNAAKEQRTRWRAQSLAVALFGWCPCSARTAWTLHWTRHLIWQRYLPLDGAFSEAFEPLVFSDGHWNAAGHALAADVIGDFLGREAVAADWR
jgi:hypothetical protein